jgi:hypothetical protein
VGAQKEVESGLEMGWPEMGIEEEGGDWRRRLWLGENRCHTERGARLG